MSFAKIRLQGPLFYGDLVHIFTQIMVRTDFSDQFRKVIVTHRLIGYTLNEMQHLSVDRITDRPDMTSAVYRGRKASTQTKQKCLIVQVTGN